MVGRKCDSWLYHGFGPDEFDEAKSLGYDLDFSEDGLHGVGDLGTGADCTFCSTSSAPSYASAAVKAAWPHLTHDLDMDLRRTRALAKGGSEGWLFIDPEAI